MSNNNRELILTASSSALERAASIENVARPFDALKYAVIPLPNGETTTIKKVVEEDADTLATLLEKNRQGLREVYRQLGFDEESIAINLRRNEQAAQTQLEALHGRQVGQNVYEPSPVSRKEARQIKDNLTIQLVAPVFAEHGARKVAPTAVTVYQQPSPPVVYRYRR